MTALMVIFIALALFFDFLNGLNDSANIVATIIASRAMNPRVALYVTAVAEFVGPFLFGVAVANTIGRGLVLPELVTMPIVFSALISAIIWSLFATLFGIPSSSSHGLVGGILGAVIFGLGPQYILMDGLLKILIVLFVSPCPWIDGWVSDNKAGLLSGSKRFHENQLVFQKNPNSHRYHPCIELWR